MCIIHFIVYIHKYFTNKNFKEVPALLFYNHILYQTYKNLNTGKLSSLCYQIPNKNNYNNVILVYGFRGFITQLFGPIQPDRTS